MTQPEGAWPRIFHIDQRLYAVLRRPEGARVSLADEACGHVQLKHERVQEEVKARLTGVQTCFPAHTDPSRAMRGLPGSRCFSVSSDQTDWSPSYADTGTVPRKPGSQVKAREKVGGIESNCCALWGIPTSKMNTVDKLFTELIRNERKDLITDHTGIKRTLRILWTNLYQQN